MKKVKKSKGLLGAYTEPYIKPEKNKDFSINEKAFTYSGYLFNSRFRDAFFRLTWFFI